MKNSFASRLRWLVVALCLGFGLAVLGAFQVLAMRHARETANGDVQMVSNMLAATINGRGKLLRSYSRFAATNPRIFYLADTDPETVYDVINKLREDTGIDAMLFTNVKGELLGETGFNQKQSMNPDDPAIGAALGGREWIDYQAVVLRDGEIQLVDTLGELEQLEIDELGTMEAFTTSGGTSTAPYSFQGRVQNYEYKTIRFPGHCQIMRAYKDFGLWSEDEVEIKGVKVRPKDLFCRVFAEALSKYEDLDQCAVRGVGIGLRGGKRVRLQVDIYDRQCQSTGFTSMERLTGFSMAIYAAAMAAGEIPAGCIRYENAMSGDRFLDEIQRRGIKVRFSEARLPSMAEVLTA